MADGDLTQYNGTPSFPATADVGTGTDPFLVPTDGAVVTASSNLPDEAPVNRSLERTKDLLLGLRGATIGDFAGASIKTFKSLQVDGTGGAVSTTSPGNIEPTGSVVADGNVVADIVAARNNLRAVRAGSLTLWQQFHNRGVYSRTGFSADGSNPPQGTVMPNTIYAKNIPKGGRVHQDERAGRDRVIRRVRR
jgi:hypothetical protein